MVNILFMVDELFTGEAKMVKKMMKAILRFKKKINTAIQKSAKTSQEQPETTDMPDLESEESADWKEQGLKILTPDQMLSRLPISLAQLKAGNNSNKLKDEIRQLLYYLYRSKEIAKQWYKSLIDII